MPWLMAMTSADLTFKMTQKCNGNGGEAYCPIVTKTRASDQRGNTISVVSPAYPGLFFIRKGCDQGLGENERKFFWIARSKGFSSGGIPIEISDKEILEIREASKLWPSVDDKNKGKVSFKTGEHVMILDGFMKSNKARVTTSGKEIVEIHVMGMTFKINSFLLRKL